MRPRIDLYRHAPDPGVLAGQGMQDREDGVSAVFETGDRAAPHYVRQPEGFAGSKHKCRPDESHTMPV